MGATLTRWLAAAAAVAGRAHERDGVPCQDFAGTSDAGPVVAVALSDGAGSAVHAEEGARIAIAGMLNLAVRFFEELHRSPGTAAPDVILPSILAELRKAADARSGSLSDFACTLLFAATDSRRFVAGQLGDGRIAVQQDARLVPFCEPVKGEFHNETVFVTSADAARHFVVSVGEADAVTGFVLMSDGSAEGLFDRRSQTFGKAASSVLAWLDHSSPADVNHALEGAIRDLQDFIKEKTGDDCSLAVLRRVAVGIEELAQRPQAFQSAILKRRSPVGLKNMLTLLAAVASVPAGRGRVEKICAATGLSESTVRRNLRFFNTTFRLEEVN